MKVGRNIRNNKYLKSMETASSVVMPIIPSSPFDLDAASIVEQISAMLVS